MAALNLDIPALHRYLWRTRDRKGCATIQMHDMAAELGVSVPSISRIVTTMSGQGRVRKVRALKGNIGIYVVRDPARF